MLRKIAIIDGDDFLKVMDGRDKAQKRTAWKLKVKKKARSGFIAVSGYKKSVGTYRRCICSVCAVTFSPRHATWSRRGVLLHGSCC